jgi:hypothetical protein
MPYEIEIREITAIIQRVVKEAFEGGFEAGRKKGAEEMRNAILNAASAGITGQLSAGLADATLSATAQVTSRAPRGLVGQVLDKVLSAHPGGLNRKELIRMAGEADGRIAPKSIFNTLRRDEGDKYRRVGKNWFLSPRYISAEDAVDADSSAEGSTHSNGGQNGPTTMK